MMESKKRKYGIQDPQNNEGLQVHKVEPKIVTELTPDLADKIWKHFQKKRYDEQVSKESVLHHLKQLKAQMGREKKKYKAADIDRRLGISDCMKMIDKKIKKINDGK